MGEDPVLARWHAAISGAEVAPEVHEPAVVALFGRRAGTDHVEPCWQRGAAPAGVDDEVGSDRPVVFGDHAGDVGKPDRPWSLVLRPLTATPRRMSIPGVRRATAATAPSSTGRLAVTVSSRSSPGRNPPMNSSGREVRTLMRNPPRASSSTSTSGSAASISAGATGAA